MKLWEQVMNTAMLGTDKGALLDDAFPDELSAINEQLKANAELDKEACFLNQAALAFNYQACGFIPFRKEGINQPKAQPEEKLYCSTFAAQVLKDVLEIESIPLLEYWLEHCADASQLVQADIVTDVLDKSVQHPKLKPLMAACSGKLGEWLGNYNPLWDFFKITPDEEIWANGKQEQRVKLLQAIRKLEPKKALEWLQQTWPKENATAKLDLLKTLTVNLAESDLPWLESLLTEKAQKVKDEVLNLLKRISGSSVIRLYSEILADSVILKKEKGLLGILSKTSIQMKLPTGLDESVFNTGIEKLSSNKAVSDEEFIVSQMIKFTPPAFWEKQFAATPGQVVEYFEKYAPLFIPSLVAAVARFGTKDWALLFLTFDKFYAELLKLLPPLEQEKYLLRFLAEDPQTLIAHAMQIDNEWSPSFALAALREMAGKPYQYNNQGVFIRLIPVAVLNGLESIEPKEPNPMQNTWWVKDREYLGKLLTLKQQIQQAFNP